MADLLFAAGAKAAARDAQGRTALTSRVVEVSNQLMRSATRRASPPSITPASAAPPSRRARSPR